MALNKLNISVDIKIQMVIALGNCFIKKIEKFPKTSNCTVHEYRRKKHIL